MALGEPRDHIPGWAPPDTCQCERCPHCGKVKTPKSVRPYVSPNTNPYWPSFISMQRYDSSPGAPGTYTING